MLMLRFFDVWEAGMGFSGTGMAFWMELFGEMGKKKCC